MNCQSAVYLVQSTIEASGEARDAVSLQAATLAGLLRRVVAANFRIARTARARPELNRARQTDAKLFRGGERLPVNAGINRGSICSRDSTGLGSARAKPSARAFTVSGHHPGRKSARPPFKQPRPTAAAGRASRLVIPKAINARYSTSRPLLVKVRHFAHGRTISRNNARPKRRGYRRVVISRERASSSRMI